MVIMNDREHKQCFHYDTSEKPIVEQVRIAKETSGKLHVCCNEIVFFLEGRVRFIFDDFPDYEGMKGQIAFLPAGGCYSYHALSPVTMIIFRLHGPIRLCDNFQVEKLYEDKPIKDPYKPRTHHFSVLEINTRVWYFLDGLAGCLSDGVKCRSFFELKIKEFLMLLCIYYTKEDIYDFFYLILSGDTAFSEYVRQRWQQFRSVAEIAVSMRLTPRQFSAKFKSVFGQTAYSWMKEGRAKAIQQELMTSGKSVKQVAFENGFGNLSQFTKFCKKELGKTPSDIKTGKNT